MNRVLILLLILLFSCKGEVYDLEYINEVLNLYPNTSNEKAYLLVPTTSCETCSDYAFSKGIELLSYNLPVKVIFQCNSNFYNNIEKRVCEQIKYNDNYYVDTVLSQKLSATHKWALIPQIIYFNKDNKVSEVQVVNKDNPSAIEDLIKNLL